MNTEIDSEKGKVKSNAEMESERYRLQLEETQQKLSSLTEQLDSVLKYNCKLGVGMDYVIATVNELQSLIEWTAGKKELKADSCVIFQKLQQLERIQKDLEKTASESEEIRFRAEQERTTSPSLHGSDNLGQEVNTDTEDAEISDLCDKNALEDQENFDTDLSNVGSLTSLKNVETVDETVDPSQTLIDDAGTSENVDVKDVNVQDQTVISNDKETHVDSHDSLGPNISEDEGLGEESRRGDSTGPSSFIEIQDTVTSDTGLNVIIPPQLSNEIVIIGPDGRDNTKEWINDQKDSKSTLDICLSAIGNLRESLRVKENELLKLSALQNDQKQIAELQEVIINFHKDTANLKSQLEATKRENTSLKEQVLELEEAENDARLQAQKLGEKLLFLQEKDSHFQAELSETKDALEKCIEELTEKEMEERELRSQLKYMEALVQKYEDQVRTMEIFELALRKKLLEQEDEFRAIEKTIAEAEPEQCERGTQTYEPFSKNVRVEDGKTEWGNGSSTSGNERGSCDLSNIETKGVQVPDDCGFLHVVDSCVQTETDLCPNALNQSSGDPDNSRNATQGYHEEPNSHLSNIECPIQKELLKRLHQLVEEDAHLQQQLHYVDQINLTLWKKLHNLEFHIGECKRKNVADDCASDSCIDSECELSSRPMSREQMHEESSAANICDSPSANRNIIACLDQSEQEIKERLSKLEKINASFEKELETREQLYLEKEKKYGEWVQTEQRFVGDLKRLTDERDSLIDQVSQLQKEKEELAARVQNLQTELVEAKERHQTETAQIKKEQEEMTAQLQQKVDQLLLKEKDHLKQITNLKLERSKSNDKAESDKLKASYIELQLELSRTRDEMREMEEDFRVRLDECRSKHMLEEARLISELEMLRNKNSSCDEMIQNFETRQTELMAILNQKERDLEEAREEYKKNMEATEEEHRAVEAELKNQLRQMEEGTAVATKALTDERMRIEKELQENIDDLRSKEEVYKARISELENNVTHLHQELHRITGDLDSGFGSEIGNNGISSFRREKLLNQLRELRDRETELREKLDEMEQKEAAYRETLEHADRIVASVEQGYKNKIEELEISEKNLKQRVGHLEEIESRLRGALHKERRSSDGRKPDDLVMELLEAEARENGLKEKVETLEQLQRNSTNKVKDLEKIREKLEAQLNDKDELAAGLEKTQQELELARKTLAKLKKSESDYKSSLQQTESALAMTETQLKNKIRSIEDEKKGLEETVNELRAQVRELKNKLETVSDEEEEERISAAITNESDDGGIQLLQNEEIDDIDYAEVDDSFEEKEEPGDKMNGSQGNVLLTKTGMQSSPSSFVNKCTPTPFQDISAKQLPSSNVSDSYDSARQNLEDCMLRAMAAMKKDMQNKKMGREETKRRMKSLLTDPAKRATLPQQVTNTQKINEENDYDELLPRPTNFRVVQQVGSDTLLVGWDYVNPSVLDGFEVYLDGHLHETVYTPDRTKALISGLNLKRPLRLSICALSRHGQMSEPAVLELPSQERNNGFYFQDEDDDDDADCLFDEPEIDNKRPYSMEW